MSDVDDILFAPVVETDDKLVASFNRSFNTYLKGQAVPDYLLKFYDSRIQVVFGVDVEIVIDGSGVTWIYPLKYLEENESVVLITYPEHKLFSNLNRCIISHDPHPQKRDPNHVYPQNIEAVREVWP